MPNRAFTLVEALVLTAVLIVIAAIAFPLLTRSRESRRTPPCQPNLKQIGLGFAQYIQDYDEKFPPIAVNKQGWAELVFPYIKSTHVFQCQSAHGGPNRQPFSCDYFCNQRLTIFEKSKIVEPALTILGGDGEDNAPTNVAIRFLPPQWPPSIRHLEGANYLFADAHVKWLRPTEVGNHKANFKNYSTSGPTFNPN